MAAAVFGWSPVIMIGRMPARLAADRRQSRGSSRGGSIMPIRPANTRSRSISSPIPSRVSVVRDARKATASVRSARPASASFASRICRRRDSDSVPPLLTDELVRAPGEQDVRRALREQQDPPLALGVGVNRAHHLALGRERQLSDAREPLLQTFRLETGLPRRDDQRSLGRIAVHGPAPVSSDSRRRCSRGRRPRAPDPARSAASPRPVRRRPARTRRTAHTPSRSATRARSP